MPKFETQTTVMEARESWRAGWKIPHPNPKSWTEKGAFQTTIFSDSTSLSKDKVTWPKNQKGFHFFALMSVLPLCSDVCWHTQGKERNKHPQMKLQCHRRAVKSHFSFPFSSHWERGPKAWRMCCSPSELFPFVAAAGVDWGVWALPLFWLAASIWHSKCPTAAQGVGGGCCESERIWSSMGSNTGNASSSSNAMKTFVSKCFVFHWCSLSKPSWQHDNSSCTFHWLVLTLVNPSWVYKRMCRSQNNEILGSNKFSLQSYG